MTTATTTAAAAADTKSEFINADAQTILACFGQLESKRIARSLQKQLDKQLTGSKLGAWLVVLRKATVLDIVDGPSGDLEYDYHIEEGLLIKHFRRWDSSGDWEDGQIVKSAKRTIRLMFDRVHEKHGDGQWEAKANDWAKVIGIGMRVKPAKKQRERDAIDRLLGM